MSVGYGVDGEPWHERYVYEVLDNRHCVIITPDEDEYVDVIKEGTLFPQSAVAASSFSVPA